jgi:GTP-binding protein
MTQELRNIAIIAHVDHGKTTLIDSIMKQSGMFRENESVSERLMDSGDLEKERGITILAKPTSIAWENIRINIIDTPGHADFGGEVERVLGMTDGVILLIDAAEGPMPQTKFVLGKALAQGLNPIVINKADRPDGRPDEVLEEIFDLFIALDANEAQLDFPILYASGRDGWCVEDLKDPHENLHPLMNLIIKHVEPPKTDKDLPFAMLVTLLASDPYLGRCLIGRVEQGSAKVNDTVKSINLKGEQIESGRLTKLLKFEGIEKVAVDQVNPGDIICVAGLAKTSVADTICETSVDTPMKSTPIDPPTMAVTITVNDSPFAGTEGKKVTSTAIRSRLLAEDETNVAITFAESDTKDAFEIGGRGELQLGVLIETMRREGFELTVSRPKVLLKLDENNKTIEPIEEVIIDVDEEYVSTVVDAMNKRKSEMQDMRASGAGKTRLTFYAPSRGLIGYQSKFLTDTRGTGVLNRLFHSYALYKGDITGRRYGALISTDTGKAVAFAIWKLQERGTMFVSHNTTVYKGMIVGEHSRDNDLDINVLKGKQLTNMRASGTDEAVVLVPPRIMSLEEMMAYINEDELLEVTPLSLRLRKRFLDAKDRKKSTK